MKSQWKRYAKSAFALTMILVASVMVTACGKKKSNAPPAAVPVPVGPALACPTCVAGSQFLMSSLSGVFGAGTGASYIELGLEFFSNGAVAVPGGQDPYARYSGPAFAHGNMYVSADPYASTCPLPVGTYVVRPYNGQPSEMYFDVMHDLVLEAQGPIRVLIHIPRGITVARTGAQIGKDGKTYPFRMQGAMYMYPQGTNCMTGVLSKFLE